MRIFHLSFTIFHFKKFQRTIRYYLYAIRSENGQTLVELLIALALCAILLPALLTGVLTSRQGKAQQEQRLQASALLKEAHETLRVVRERGWEYIANNGTYHVTTSSATYMLSPGAETIGGYTRSIVISDVLRDSSGAISTNSGAVDPSTKKIVTTVSWGAPIAASVSETEYLTRYLSNKIVTQTTQAEFNSGSKSGTTVVNTSGGEIVLGAGGNADWCSPNQSIVAQLDLPKSGVANALSAYQGRAIAGTGENASGVSLADIAISNSNPPVPTIAGTFDGYKTNDVYLDSTYAYIATDSNSKEVVIVDLTTQQEVGSFDAPGSSDATSVFVSGTKGYVTAGFTLYIFDVSNKSGSRPQLGSFFFLGTATSVIVSGNYAYVSLASSPIEMQIIDITDPQSMGNIGWADVNGTDGKRIFVNQSSTRAYLATGIDASKPEFFIVDISQKTGSRPTIGSYNANGMNPANLSVVPSNKALLVGSGGEEYQVIDISNEANPTRCGGLEVNTGVKGVVGILEADGDAYSYIVTGDVSLEFKIIEGGPGGQFSVNGTFESSTIDATTAAAFNRFVAGVQTSSQTGIQFQFAGSDANPATGNCSGVTFTFVGPGATTSAYFATSSAAIPMSDSGAYKNPARCFRYKAYLTTSDEIQTPILNDMTLNYSP